VSDWGWRSERTGCGGHPGAFGMRALALAVPFVTVGLLLLMLYFVGGTLTTAKGVLFDLPVAGVGDEAVTESVALVLPMRHETLVFFDDSRYVVGSVASMKALGKRLAERFGKGERKTLLVLADRRVSCGDLMEVAAVARLGGVARLLFAEKSVKEVSD